MTYKLTADKKYAIAAIDIISEYVPSKQDELEIKSKVKIGDGSYLVTEIDIEKNYINHTFKGKDRYDLCNLYVDKLTIPLHVKAGFYSNYCEIKTLKLTSSNIVGGNKLNLSLKNIPCYNNNYLKERFKIRKVILGKEIKKIGNYAFDNWFFLESVTLEDNTSIEKIGEGAFYKCSSLKEIKNLDVNSIVSIRR